MSTRETVLAAIATTLAGLAGGRVYRARRDQLPALPAIVVTPDAEEVAEAVLGVLDRRLRVAVSIFAEGPTPDAAADALLAAVWAALTADLQLGIGGTDVQLEPAHSISWEYAENDQVRATLFLAIAYRTPFGAM